MELQHWRACRKDFQEQDTNQNRLLWAEWEPLTESWTFRGAGAQREPEKIFKSLANKAATGLADARSPSPGAGWRVWLNALREENRDFEALPFHMRLSLDEWERLGLPESKGKIVLVSITDEMAESNRQNGFETAAGVQTNKEFDGTAGVLRSLFAISANYCLELESRAQCQPSPAPSARSLGTPNVELTPAIVAIKPSRGKQRRSQVPIERTKQEIRRLIDAGLTHQQVCERLDQAPRPANAAWNALSWPEAFRDRRYRGAVKSWISRV